MSVLCGYNLLCIQFAAEVKNSEKQAVLEKQVGVESSLLSWSTSHIAKQRVQTIHSVWQWILLGKIYVAHLFGPSPKQTPTL